MAKHHMAQDITAQHAVQRSIEGYRRGKVIDNELWRALQMPDTYYRRADLDLRYGSTGQVIMPGYPGMILCYLLEGAIMNTDSLSVPSGVSQVAGPCPVRDRRHRPMALATCLYPCNLARQNGSTGAVASTTSTSTRSSARNATDANSNACHISDKKESRAPPAGQERDDISYKHVTRPKKDVR